MDVIRKDAPITNTDDDFPGSFEVILSTGTKDRDGEEVLHTEWKTPLPEHITFDVDHGLSVAATVGSGTPRIDEKGRMIVSGTYSSLPRAQEVRTLVKEGHIKTTSVAFARGKKTLKDGKTTVERELLNGSFVAIPANTEAIVLSSKAVKSGRRNSHADQVHLDAIARHAVALGATIATGGDTNSNEDVAAGKGYRPPVFKSIAGSLEATQDRVRDALQDANPDAYISLRGTVPDSAGGGYVIYAAQPNDGPWNDDLFQQSYTDSGSVVTLTGAAKPVDLTEVVTSDPDEEADSAAEAESAAAAKAAAADTATTAAEDHSIEKQAALARMRLYNTLSER